MDATTAEVRISGSQVANYMECQKKFELAHIDKLMPANGNGKALVRGSTGHKIMEVWAKNHMKGVPTEESLSLAMAAGMEYNTGFAVEVFPMIAYWVKNVFPNLGWKILEVEKTYYAKVGTAKDGRPLMFPFTIDLLVEAEGKIVIVDHKFQADPFEDEMIELMPQLKKYIVALRSQKINVHHAIYNTFRTRTMKAGPAERNVMQKTVPSVAQLKSAMLPQIQMMHKIDQHEGEYLRVLNKNICTYCPFKKICLVETNGEDASLIKQFDYVTTDYGYDDE